MVTFLFYKKERNKYDNDGAGFLVENVGWSRSAWFSVCGARPVLPRVGGCETKCLVVFSKCLVIFSKCFVVFSKCRIVAVLSGGCGGGRGGAVGVGGALLLAAIAAGEDKNRKNPLRRMQCLLRAMDAVSV